MTNPGLVIIDGTVIDAKGKGVSRYAVNLIRHLAKVDIENRYLVLLDAKADIPDLPVASNFDYRKVNARPMLAWRLIRLPLLIRQYHYSILHVLSELVPVVKTHGLIVTIHEIPHLRNVLQPKGSFYEQLSRVLHEILFPLTLKRATRLIAVSQSTALDLTHYGADSVKIQVIPEAADEKFTCSFASVDLDQVRYDLQAHDGYVLSFATGDGRENPQLVLKAWAELLNRNPQLSKRLVFAGCKDQTLQKLKLFAEQVGVDSTVTFLGYVDDAFLPRLYGAADLYVDISFYEGFGLQCLEAMACGVPVIASSIPSMSEVVGQAGILVEPINPSALASAMANVLNDIRLREALQAKSRERAKQFSWEQAARATLMVYQSIGSSRRNH
jgi:glycosyltransferase involved in cell wall biosynthesis